MTTITIDFECDLDRINKALEDVRHAGLVPTKIGRKRYLVTGDGWRFMALGMLMGRSDVQFTWEPRVYR